MRHLAWLLVLVPLLTWSQDISVNIKSKTKDLARLARYKQASALLVDVVNFPDTRQEILGHRFDGKPGFASSAHSPERVLQTMLNGSETLTPGIDHTWSWDVVFYEASNNVVGYTYPNVTTLWVNTKYMDRYDDPEIVRNQAHEMMHKLGYGHDFKATKRRPYSVPYAIGRIAEKQGWKILKARIAAKPPTPNRAPRPAPKARKPWWRRLF
jgi:hypothetical protein